MPFDDRTHADTLTPTPTSSRVPARPFLFVALECERPLGGSARYALGGVDVVTIGRGSERAVQRRNDRGTRSLMISIPDPKMSRNHAKLERQGSCWALEDTGSTNGCFVGNVRVER